MIADRLPAPLNPTPQSSQKCNRLGVGSVSPRQTQNYPCSLAPSRLTDEMPHMNRLCSRPPDNARQSCKGEEGAFPRDFAHKALSPCLDVRRLGPVHETSWMLGMKERGERREEEKEGGGYLAKIGNWTGLKGEINDASRAHRPGAGDCRPVSLSTPVNLHSAVVNVFAL